MSALTDALVKAQAELPTKWAAVLGIASEEDTDAATLPTDDVPF